MGDSHTVDRRRLLQSIGVATATGLAGCNRSTGGGDITDKEDNEDLGDSGDNQDLGERVPPIEFNWWSDDGANTQIFEDSVAIIEPSAEELGLRINPSPASLTNTLDSQSNDQRTHHLSWGGYSLRPARLDPDELTRAYHIMDAGANGAWNPSQFANCEFSKLADQQRNAGSQEKRQQLVNDAHSILSEEVGIIPVYIRNNYSAVNTNQIEPGPTGAMGILETGIVPLLTGSTKSGTDAIRSSLPPNILETTKHVTITGASQIYFYSNTIYSPLIGFNENFELEGVLAEGMPDVSDDGLSYEFTLRDTTFHNGRTITAEDVKWTFELLAEGSRQGAYPFATDPGYESIEAVDEKTVRFNLQDTTPTFLTVTIPAWGVLPKDEWVEAGVEDDLAGFDDPRIGSGPYKVDSYSRGTSITFSPHDGHPRYNPDSNLVFQGFQGPQAAYRAFQQGEINVLMTTLPSFANEIREQMDNARVVLTEGFTPIYIHPQTNFGPTKFREFRMAFSHIIDRQRIVQEVLFGDTEPQLYASSFTKHHPWWPGEDNLTNIAGTASADVDDALSLLEENGWGQDSNGNLRYPADADLSPLWPKGSEPAEHPDKFPCVSDFEG